ncbi:hypothetical protein COOONC_00656 [Cooperia oncophora]
MIPQFPTPFYCKTFRIEATVNTMHVWTIAALSAHRYWKISRPMASRMSDTVARAHCMLLAVFLMALLFRLPTFLIELQLRWMPIALITKRIAATEAAIRHTSPQKDRAQPAKTRTPRYNIYRIDNITLFITTYSPTLYNSTKMAAVVEPSVPHKAAIRHTSPQKDRAQPAKTRTPRYNIYRIDNITLFITTYSPTLYNSTKMAAVVEPSVPHKVRAVVHN